MVFLLYRYFGPKAKEYTKKLTLKYNVRFYDVFGMPMFRYFGIPTVRFTGVTINSFIPILKPKL